MEDWAQMDRLRRQGFSCSQILLHLGLQTVGKENLDLIRSVQGLAGGIGYTGGVCGALTGAACLVGLYAGKGRAEDEDDPRLLFMIEDLVRKFKETVGSRYGGIECDQILEGGGNQMTSRCGEITHQTWQWVRELLVENGFDLLGREDGN